MFAIDLDASYNVI